MSYQSFKQLEAWKQARELRKRVYALTKQLPSDEKFNVVSQMRRAVLSVTNNIAEGHGRFHYQEFIQFLRQARGSLEELRDDLTLCEDESYAPRALTEALDEQINLTRRLVNGLIRHLQEAKVTSLAREDSGDYVAAEPEVDIP
ncbi:MAG TPA: four helix bundle protein [Verrucomicrobiae bacterium]|nr:four helix bundle protein [Verrucomicrobiae bacterium]